jgi:hypothetical protein
MDIPTNDNGEFEIVDADDNVWGRGTLIDGQVDMLYGQDLRSSMTMDLDQFATAWAAVAPPGLSFRATA